MTFSDVSDSKFPQFFRNNSNNDDDDGGEYLF